MFALFFAFAYLLEQQRRHKVRNVAESVCVTIGLADFLQSPHHHLSSMYRLTNNKQALQWPVALIACRLMRVEV
jgi:hypothetical protein